jgi:hypothetical protein
MVMRRVNTIYIAYIYCLSDNFANRHAIVAGEMRPVFLFSPVHGRVGACGFFLLSTMAKTTRSKRDQTVRRHEI